MIYKKEFYILLISLLFLTGCGEEFLAGVTKGGTGDGANKPKNAVNGELLNHDYYIWLSQPKTDYCSGVKRTLSFMHPITHELIERDQLVHIQTDKQIEHELIGHLMWENATDEAKIITGADCQLFLILEEEWLGSAQGGFGVNSMNRRCSIRNNILNPHTVYVASEDYRYKLHHSSVGQISQFPSIQFEPMPFDQPQCPALSISYSIQNRME